MIHAEWIAPSSPDTPSYETNNNYGHPCIGSYRNTIFYIQGDMLMEFYLNNNSLNMFNGILPIFVTGEGQYWTQIGHSLFILELDYMLYTLHIHLYNLFTKTFQENWNNDIPTNVGRGACLASTNDSLYVVGGGTLGNVDMPPTNTLQILDLYTNQWEHGPHMNDARTSVACIVSSSNNNLYAIGGDNNANINSLDTIEFISTIDIDRQSWKYINNKLDEGLCCGRAVIYGIYIYYIGGYDPIETVKIIDTSTNIVSTSPDPLAIGTVFSAPIAVNNVIHSFGGMFGGKWQYYNLDTVMHPSKTPATTNSPNTRGLTTTQTIQDASTTEELTTATSSATTDESTAYTHTTDISITTRTVPLTTVAQYIDHKVNEFANSDDTDNENDDINTNLTNTHNESLLDIWIGVIIAICICISIIYVIRKRRQRNKATTMQMVIKEQSNYHKEIKNENMELNQNIEHFMKQNRQIKTPGAHPHIKDDEFIVCDDEDVTIGNHVTSDHGIMLNMDDIQTWLKSFNLLIYYQQFIVNGYDSMNFIKEITASNELSELGIINEIHQAILIKEISKMRGEDGFGENGNNLNEENYHDEGAAVEGSTAI